MTLVAEYVFKEVLKERHDQRGYAIACLCIVTVDLLPPEYLASEL